MIGFQEDAGDLKLESSEQYVEVASTLQRNDKPHDGEEGKNRINSLNKNNYERWSTAGFEASGHVNVILEQQLFVFRRG